MKSKKEHNNKTAYIISYMRCQVYLHWSRARAQEDGMLRHAVQLVPFVDRRAGGQSRCWFLLCLGWLILFYDAAFPFWILFSIIFGNFLCYLFLYNNSGFLPNIHEQSKTRHHS